MASTSGSAVVPAPVLTDASVWVAFFVAADVNYVASRNWIDSHTRASGMLVAPSILLTEVAAALSRRLGRPGLALQVVASLNRLTLLRIVQTDGKLMTEATDIAANYRLRGADAIYVAAARQLGITLLTWDTEQLTRPAAIITAVTP